MSANYLWRAVCRAARAFGRMQAEQAHMWDAWAQANRAAVPTEGPLRWIRSLDGHRLAGSHLPVSTGIRAGETP